MRKLFKRYKIEVVENGAAIIYERYFLFFWREKLPAFLKSSILTPEQKAKKARNAGFSLFTGRFIDIKYALSWVHIMECADMVRSKIVKIKMKKIKLGNYKIEINKLGNVRVKERFLFFFWWLISPAVDSNPYFLLHPQRAKFAEDIGYVLGCNTSQLGYFKDLNHAYKWVFRIIKFEEDQKENKKLWKAT